MEHGFVMRRVGAFVRVLVTCAGLVLAYMPFLALADRNVLAPDGSAQTHSSVFYETVQDGIEASRSEVEERGQGPCIWDVPIIVSTEDYDCVYVSDRSPICATGFPRPKKHLWSSYGNCSQFKGPVSATEYVCPPGSYWPYPVPYGCTAIQKDRCEKETNVGNPCSAATGEKVQEEIDFHGAGTSQLEFRRRYSSRALKDGGIRPSWQTSADQLIGGELRYLGPPAAASESVVLFRPNGMVAYTLVDGQWLSDTDTNETLIRTTTGWLFTRRDGTQEVFSHEDLGHGEGVGHLKTISDPSGLTQTLEYDSTQRVSSLRGPFGHTLTIGYNVGSRLSTVIDPAGNIIQYSYSANNVSRVDYPDGTARIYHYENTSWPDNLTGISDVAADGTVTRFATYGYQNNALSRATLTQHADVGNGGPQVKFTLAYNSATQTTVTNAVGTKEVMTFATNLNVKNLTQKKNLTDNKTLTQTFDANNNRTCRKDEEGRVTRWAYNATNQKVSMTEGLTGTCPTGTTTPETRTTTYEYLSPTLDLPRFIRRPSVAAGQTYETEIVYGDTRFPNLPTQVIQRGFTPAGSPVSRTLTMGYNTFGEVNLINGPRLPADPGMNGLDDVTTMEYYECTTGGACGQLKKTTNALGQITTYDSYYADGRLQQMTDPNGLKTTYTYDPRGRTKTVTQTGLDGRTATWQYRYTPWGDVSQSTDPAGVVLDYAYDAAHYLRTITDAVGNQIRYGYDLKGNRTSETYVNADGTTAKQATFAFDIRNHLLKRDEGGNITQLVMDAVGNLTKEVAPNQYPATTPATTNQYDSLNRLTKTIDRLNGAANFAFDPNDRIKSVTAPNSAATSYDYDDLGNLLKEISADRGTTTYGYDAAGNPVSRTDGRGIAVTFTYDAQNRLVTENYPGTADDRSYTHDTCTFGKGKLCLATDGAGSTTFAYDALNALAQTVRTQSGMQYTTGYTRGLDGRLDALTYPDGRTVSLNRDLRRRVAGISTTLNGSPVTIASNRLYNAAGTLNTQTLGNGLTESRTYDLAGRLKTQSLGGIEPRTYTYDFNTNLTARTYTGSSLTDSYDTLDRLTTDNDGTTETYTYDTNGNRKTKNSASYTYLTNTNRLTTIAGTALTYDAAGNILSNGAQSFTYTGANELATATSQTGTPGGSYQYDFQHRRVQKTTTGVTLYHYDDQGRLIEETQTNGNLIRDYLWDDETPIAQIDRNLTTGIETLTYLHTDHEGTPRFATDSTQRIVWRFEGNAMGDTPPNEDPDQDGILTRVHLRYPGQYYDQESGLHYNWNRYYDPRTGRYLTSDPIGLAGGLNTYAYVLNNPLRYTDPMGLMGNRQGAQKGIAPCVKCDDAALNRCLDLASSDDSCYQCTASGNPNGTACRACNASAGINLACYIIHCDVKTNDCDCK